MIPDQYSELLDLPPDTPVAEARRHCQQLLGRLREEIAALPPGHPGRPGLESRKTELTQALAYFEAQNETSLADETTPSTLHTPPPATDHLFQHVEELLDQGAACLELNPPDHVNAAKYYVAAEKEIAGKTLPAQIKSRLQTFKQALDQVKRDVLRAKIAVSLKRVTALLEQEPPGIAEAREKLSLVGTALRQSPDHSLQNTFEILRKTLQDIEKRLAHPPPPAAPKPAASAADDLEHDVTEIPGRRTPTTETTHTTSQTTAAPSSGDDLEHDVTVIPGRRTREAPPSPAAQTAPTPIQPSEEDLEHDVTVIPGRPQPRPPEVRAPANIPPPAPPNSTPKPAQTAPDDVEGEATEVLQKPPPPAPTPAPIQPKVQEVVPPIRPATPVPSNPPTPPSPPPSPKRPTRPAPPAPDDLEGEATEMLRKPPPAPVELKVQEVVAPVRPAAPAPQKPQPVPVSRPQPDDDDKPPAKPKKLAPILAAVVILVLLGIAYAGYVKIKAARQSASTDQNAKTVAQGTSPGNSSPAAPANTTPAPSANPITPVTPAPVIEKPPPPPEIGELTITVKPDTADLSTNGVSLGHPAYPVVVKGLSQHEVSLVASLDGYTDEARNLVFPSPGAEMRQTIELQPRLAVLVVQVEPAVAEVSLQRPGGNPVQVKVPPEGIQFTPGVPIDVTVEIPGFEPKTISVPALKPGERHEIAFGKLKSLGTLRLKADPPDARFTLVYTGKDPIPYGPAPIIEGILPKLEFRVIAERAGYVSQSNRFTLKSNEVRDYDFGKLKPLPAVEVKTDTDGAEVSYSLDKGTPVTLGVTNRISGLPYGSDIAVTLHKTGFTDRTLEIKKLTRTSETLDFGRLTALKIETPAVPVAPAPATVIATNSASTNTVANTNTTTIAVSPADVDQALHDIATDIDTVRSRLPLTDASRRNWNDQIKQFETRFKGDPQAWARLTGPIEQLRGLVNTTRPLQRVPNMGNPLRP